eukprot:CAMPEP_0183352944 /NCGR_PEP_ID=MMETSP0164_2-20130417/31723_1 /TAXON_ID=221442 /ORGANISM="Coccolithus pelagicus ssp braarudi, Strain PLY182g" /LENGTH=357 /DNA_ID=CAMNT_0025525521 /DNA_START=71 /DNA_END=1144 /DNA_ORIENTATION=-
MKLPMWVAVVAALVALLAMESSSLCRFALIMCALCVTLAVAQTTESRAGTGDLAKLFEALAACKPSGTLKTIWLVRHTRSHQNSSESLFQSKSPLRKAQGLWGMMSGFNAPPSEKGWLMLRARAPLLSQWLANAGCEITFYSPLARAAATHAALCSKLAVHHMPLDFLKEQGRREHLWAKFGKRVRWFHSFLAALPVATAAFIGHSKFFRLLIFGNTKDQKGLGYIMGNVDMWRVDVVWAGGSITPTYTVREVFTTIDTLVYNSPVELATLGALITLGAVVHVEPAPPGGRPVSEAVTGVTADRLATALGEVLAERATGARIEVDAHWNRWVHATPGWPGVDESIEALRKLVLEPTK